MLSTRTEPAMTSSLTDSLLHALQGAPMARLGAQLGLDPRQAHAAAGTALPLLVEAMAHGEDRRHARPAPPPRPAAAAAPDPELFPAHPSAGSAADPGLPPSPPGNAVCGHLVGDLVRATGLAEAQAVQLLQRLTPLVMAARPDPAPLPAVPGGDGNRPGSPPRPEGTDRPPVPQDIPQAGNHAGTVPLIRRGSGRLGSGKR